MADLQPSLFSTGLTADPGALQRIQRLHLSCGAWIDHLEGWLTDDLDVFGALREATPWQQVSRVMYDRVVEVPRLTAWYTDPTRLPHAALVRAFEALNSHYGPEPFITAGLCWYRDGRGGGESLSFPLGHGDLLVMGGTCQRTWEHAVPKVRSAGPRMSIQFRQAGVA